MFKSSFFGAALRKIDSFIKGPIKNVADLEETGSIAV